MFFTRSGPRFRSWVRKFMQPTRTRRSYPRSEERLKSSVKLLIGCDTHKYIIILTTVCWERDSWFLRVWAFSESPWETYRTRTWARSCSSGSTNIFLWAQLHIWFCCFPSSHKKYGLNFVTHQVLDPFGYDSNICYTQIHLVYHSQIRVVSGKSWRNPSIAFQYSWAISCFHDRRVLAPNYRSFDEETKQKGRIMKEFFLR